MDRCFGVRTIAGIAATARGRAAQIERDDLVMLEMFTQGCANETLGARDQDLCHVTSLGKLRSAQDRPF
jgi:hypothetical protein